MKTDFNENIAVKGSTRNYELNGSYTQQSTMNFHKQRR